MSFHNSAGEINFEGTTLKAGLRAGNGAWYDAEINLDEILGNADGKPSSPFPSSLPVFFPLLPSTHPPLVSPPNFTLPIPDTPNLNPATQS